MEWKNRALELVGSRCGTKIQNNLNDLWKRREGIKCLWPWPAQPPDLALLRMFGAFLKVKCGVATQDQRSNCDNLL